MKKLLRTSGTICSTENAEFPGPEEAAEVVWTAVNDGKDQIVYPTDRVCRKLYGEYKDTNIEDFKITLYDKLFC